ncbi:MAG: HTTM domain-containing protein [Haloferacaceae archaeon]
MALHRRLPDRSGLASAIRRRVAIDARSLAAFRTAVGVLLIADLLLRSRDLVAFYTDAGVLPREALAQFSAEWAFSLHALSGAAWYEGLLFVVAGVVAAALAAGYRTRVATFASWVLLVSLQNRNPVVLNGGDVLLRLVLLWAIFVPLGERWSLDARRRAGRAAGETEASAPRRAIASLGTAALLGQVVIMYGSNALFKLNGTLWLDGTAIQYVFSLDQFTILLGDVLANYPLLLHAGALLWMALLVCSPLLLGLTGWRRAVLVGLFMSMHLGMLLTMQLGLFPLIAVAALVPFLPGEVWDAVGLGAVPTDDGDRSGLATGAEAGKGTLPSAFRRRAGQFRSGVVAVLFVLVLLSNLGATGYQTVPDQADPVVQATAIDQRWSMFAPDPMRVDGWYVVPGELENGSQVDALHGGAVTWDRPPELAATYPNARWRKYLVNLWRGWFHPSREYLSRYLCRKWNDEHATKMEQVTLYYMEQPSRLDGPEPIEKKRLLRHTCGAA